MASSTPLSQDTPWKPWVIPFVALVCTFTLIFSYYKLLERLCSTSFSRNLNQQRILNETNPDDPSVQFQSQGLDVSVTWSLPVTQFKKKDEAEAAEHSQSNADCAICLGEFEEGEWLKKLPKCSHEFHISCIDTWFVSHSNCPLCRSQVYDFMHDCLFPMDTALETLSQEEIQERASHYQMLQTLSQEEIQERASHYQMLRFAILGNSPLGREARYAH
ncbi:hypothetical protein ACE6H2_019541 [Prunus campanulata]